MRPTGQYDNRATRPVGAAPAAGSKHDEPGASNLARSAEQPKSQARERAATLAAAADPQAAAKRSVKVAGMNSQSWVTTVSSACTASRQPSYAARSRGQPSRHSGEETAFFRGR